MKRPTDSTASTTSGQKNTPCLSTLAESTPKKSPVKILPAKSLPSEEHLDFLHP